jgi:alpha-glucosidase
MTTAPRIRPVLAALLLGACRSSPVLPPASAPAPVASARPAAPAPADLPALGRRPDGVDVFTPGAHLRATFPLPGVVRVRLWPLGASAPEASFAVEAPAGGAPVPFQLEEAGEEVVLRARGVGLRVNRRTLAFTLLDGGGAPSLEVPEGPAWDREGHGGALGFALRPGEHVYGLGDKAHAQDRRGAAYDLWNYDNFNWGAGADPLYKSLPFAILVDSGRARGLFVDSPARAHADVGAAKPDRLRWEVERGAFDLYLFAGPEPKNILSAYTALTGRMPLPPRWALGYHQSRYSYESEKDVRAVARRFDAEHFPVDAIYLDIDFLEGLAPFHTDHRSFPHFEAMVQDLLAARIRTVVITDLHVKLDAGTEPFDSGVRGDHYILDPGAWQADGTPRPGAKPFVGTVWPGASVFPEFTLARTRAWWGSLYREYVAQGVAGFWDDMNEPALFNVTKTMPQHLRHRLEGGGTADHVAIHNVYGTLQARATYEGVLALRPSARPYVLTRAAYAGAQRWAASWTGDNRADREGLALSIPTLLGLGASGYAFVGADVGGFVGCPDEALLTEWMELGAWQPLFKNHSNKGTCRREPWLDGPAALARRRAAVVRRYELLPYLYTVFEESTRTGLPVMRPLWLEHPGDAAVATEDRAFLLGRELLVAPKLVAGDGPYAVTLPAGDWFDVATGARIEGGRRELTPPPGGSVRVFARAGAIVPEGPAVERAGDVPQGPLTVHVWPGPDCRGELYLDAGDGFGYRAGELRHVHYMCTPAADGISITAASAGPYPTWWTATNLVVHAVPRAPGDARVDGGTASGGALAVHWDSATQSATAVLPGGGAEWSVTLRW